MWPAAFYVATGGSRGRRRRLLLGPFTEKSLAQCALPFARELAAFATGPETRELHVTRVRAPRGLSGMKAGEWNDDAIGAYALSETMEAAEHV